MEKSFLCDESFHIFLSFFMIATMFNPIFCCVASQCEALEDEEKCNRVHVSVWNEVMALKSERRKKISQMKSF